jgi:hypothetical protein
MFITTVRNSIHFHSLYFSFTTCFGLCKLHLQAWYLSNNIILKNYYYSTDPFDFTVLYSVCYLFFSILKFVIKLDTICITITNSNYN